MPGGLRDVSQRFDADASGYLAEIGKMIAANREVLASIREVQKVRIDVDSSAAMAKIGEVRAALGGLGDKTVKIDVDTSGAMAKVAALKAALGDAGGGGGIGAVFGGGGADSAAMIRELRDISASMDQATTSLGNMESHLTSIRRDVADSSADLMMQTQVLRDNADAHNAAATAVAALAAASRGGGGGGGGTALAAAAGAAAGGGGGGGGGAPSFVPWAGGGWQAVRFWGMMGAEVASTVVPALVAAGSAALVGAQGFEQLQGRAQAIYTVSEALGTSLNKSFGQFVVGGKYGNALQNAQNAAAGGVYELAGAGINLLRAGGGQGLLAEGTSTIAMLDRSAANISPNLGNRIASLMGGGTGYLQQFGSVGANLGNTLLNVAPNLAGVGPMLLGGLQGATGLASTLSRDIPGPVQKELFTYEAASRWLPAILGGQGLIGRMLGLRGVGGLGGLLGKGGEALFARGAGGILGDIGLGAIGAGDTLAALTGPETGGLSLALQGLVELSKTMPTRAMRQVAGLQAGISQAGFTSAWQPLGRAITTTTGLAASQPGGWQSNLPAMETSSQIARFGPQAGEGPSTAQIYQNAATGFSQQMGNLINAGPQLQAALSKAGIKGASMADAFQIAQNSLLDLSHAFDSHHNLTQQAQKMMANYVAAIGPMTQSPGAFGAAVAATQIMSSGAMQNLSKVNQAMDSMTQIMTGGPLGAAQLVGLGGASRGSPFGAGLRTALGPVLNPLTAAQAAAGQAQAPATTAQVAQALTGFFTPQSAAAWTGFTGTSTTPGVISTLQQNMDQARTWLTLGAISQPQAAGLSAYEIQQQMGYGSKSPAALAMLEQQATQAGIPGVSMGESYKNFAKAVNQAADSTKTATAAMTQATVSTANLPATAKQFAQSLAPTLQTQQVADAATNVMNLRNAALTGGVNKTALNQLVADMKGAGVTSAAGIQGTLGAALQQAGVSKTMQIKIEAQVQVPKLPAITAPPTVKYPSTVAKPIPPPPTPGGRVQYSSAVTRPIPPPPPLGGTVVYHSVVIGPGPTAISGGGPGMRLVAGQSGFKVPGTGSGDIFPAMLEPGELVVPKGMVAAGAVDHLRGSIPGFQGGGLMVADYAGVSTGIRATLQDFGSSLLSDIQNGFSQIAGSMRSGGVQPIFGGFGSRLPYGGFGGPPGGGGGGGGAAPAASAPLPVQIASVAQAAAAVIRGYDFGPPGGARPLPPAAQKVIDDFEKTFRSMGNPWGKLASQILQGLLDGVKNSSRETAAMAQALTSKVTQEINYGKNLASQTLQGLNIAGMQVPAPGSQVNMNAAAPGTRGYNPAQWNAYVQAYASDSLPGGTNAAAQPQSVQQQMQSYLKSIQSFQKDIGQLSKGGLNKNILQQLLSAGPVQGDALAQSIMGGQGGIKAVNQLYGQISKASTNLGVAGMEAVYGMPKGKSVDVAAKVTGAPAVKALQSAINAIRGKTVTIAVKIDMSGGGGGGAGGGGGGGVGGLSGLSSSQIDGLVRQIQAKLLQQAKRNRRTGVKLPPPYDS
jgi:hypothetical protein